MAWLPASTVNFFLEAVSESIRPHPCGLERKDPGTEVILDVRVCWVWEGNENIAVNSSKCYLPSSQIKRHKLPKKYLFCPMFKDWKESYKRSNRLR